MHQQCITCRNTASRDHPQCGTCRNADEEEAERERLFGEMDMAISDLAHDGPTQRACEAIRDVLRYAVGR